MSYRRNSAVNEKWYRGVVVITTVQIHSKKLKLKFCAGLNPARGVSEIRDAEDLSQWPRLEIRLNVFSRSTMPQKLFIIIIIIIIIKRAWLEQKSGQVNGHGLFIIKCHKHSMDILKIANKRKKHNGT